MDSIEHISIIDRTGPANHTSDVLLDALLWPAQPPGNRMPGGDLRRSMALEAETAVGCIHNIETLSSFGLKCDSQIEDHDTRELTSIIHGALCRRETAVQYLFLSRSRSYNCEKTPRAAFCLILWFFA